MPDEVLYCCDHARQVNDVLLGSAPRVDVWLLVEYNAVWGNKAFPESTLDVSIKAHLQAALDSIPDTRLMFIRQPERRTEKFAFFVVDSRMDRLKIRAFELNSYTDLVGLDIQKLVEDNVETSFEMEAPEFLYLICTNGKRDVACARYGVPMYQAMTANRGDLVWQSTHLGGHRFAATSAFLPHGIVYGHLEFESVGQMMEDYESGILHPEFLRGRSVYDLPIQAAEVYLLENVSARVEAFELVDSSAIGETETRVVFSGPNGRRHQVIVRRELSDYEVLKSTADLAAVQVPIFRVVEHKEVLS